MTAQPEALPDLFDRTVDGLLVRFVQPIDATDQWGAYDHTGRFLGTLNRRAGDTWHHAGSSERNADLDDAVRAMRRPASWPADRAQVKEFAQQLLADPDLLLLDLETTGLTDAYAVQIAAVGVDGTTALDLLLNPQAVIEPGATAVHGITQEQAQVFPVFGEVLATLTRVLHGRTVVVYSPPADDADGRTFDQDVIRRELVRHHHGDQAAADEWTAAVRWVDAMEPYAAWRGLWDAGRGRYRRQKLGGPHDAAGDARQLLYRLREMAGQSAHR